MKSSISGARFFANHHKIGKLMQSLVNEVKNHKFIDISIFLSKNDFFRAHNFFEVKSFVNKHGFFVALIFIFHNVQIQYSFMPENFVLTTSVITS